MLSPISLTVKHITLCTPDTIKVTFEETELVYVPGQFLTLMVFIGGITYRRAYSLCTVPVVDPYPAITIKRVPRGKVSNHLNDYLRVGNTLEVLPPAGRFTLQVASSRHMGPRHILLVAAGSGITPLIALLKAALQESPTTQVTLLYGSRNETNIIFYQALNELVNQHSARLRVLHVLSQPSVSWQGSSGRITAHHIQEALGYAPTGWPTQAFLCGPAGLMDTAAKTLRAAGIPEDQIHLESFDTPLPTASKALEKTRQVTIHFEGKVHEYAVKPGETLLDAALEAEIDLPFACQTGSCNVCQAKCLQGKVEMTEKEGLTEEELQAGYVLTCVAYPRSDDVVLEAGGEE